MFPKCKTILSLAWSFFSSLCAFQIVQENRWTTTGTTPLSFVPAWTKGLLAIYDKAGPGPLLPSVLDRTDQYSFTDCISEVNNQTDQGLMPSAGFLLSHVCFWKSLFQLHPFPMCMLVAPLFPFSSSCMLLCGISSGRWTPFRCSSMICQGILSTGVWIPQEQLSDLIQSHYITETEFCTFIILCPGILYASFCYSKKIWMQMHKT